MIDIPTKLKDDSITEALCQLRFDTPEMSEIVIGRLIDVDRWKHYTKARLPISDIPEPVRRANGNLKYEPLFELADTDRTRLIRIGGNVISYHVLREYCGWVDFQKELEHVLVEPFEKISDLTIERIGFRYINSLVEERHFINGAQSLNVQLSVAEEPITGPVNLNFIVDNSDFHQTLTRIASPEFVKGNFPPKTSVVIDVDVFTRKDFSSSSLKDVLGWINQAHDYEKSAFFKLLPKTAVEKLREK